jgi:sugar phosphate isomerase/epimerase
MRLGGPLFDSCPDPDRWISALQREGYSAAYSPVAADAPDDIVRAYARAAQKTNIVIAEVGAWSNPLSHNEQERREAVAKCQQALALAHRIGARCCVNISGSRGEQWDGPHPENLTDETFDLIVESVRTIIDAVEPARTFYTLETMPWMYPDSAESYLRLMRAVDRRQFGVHFDPVNLICSPQRYFNSGAIISEFCAALGPHIRSCHAKDIALSGRLTVHLDEVRPGLGGLDYAAFLRELDRLDPNTPLMIEHLSSREEYALAAAHIRSVAAGVGVRPL